MKEYHVFMMTFFHPSFMATLPRFASSWQKLQEMQHKLQPPSHVARTMERAQP